MAKKTPPLSPTLSRRGKLRMVASRAFVDIHKTAKRSEADWPTLRYYISGGW